MRAANPLAVATLLAGILMPFASHAHKPSDSYLSLELQGAKIAGRWDIALRDLDYLFGLDRDSSGTITWGEVQARRPEIERYALSRLKLEADRVFCPLRSDGFQAVRHSDGSYVVLRFVAECPKTVGVLAIDYQMLFDR